MGTNALVPALEARVQAAEARVDAAEAERDQAVAASKARDLARRLASEANKDLVPASLDAIVAEATRNPLPLDSERRLDTQKFGAVVDEARKNHETFLDKTLKNGTRVGYPLKGRTLGAAGTRVIVLAQPGAREI